MRPKSQDLEASARVLKKRAAQSHLSMRTLLMALFSYKYRLKSQALKSGLPGENACAVSYTELS
jgi:hypothetical protein